MPFASTGVGLLELDRALGCAERRLVDEDRAGRSGALQSCGRVHDVARDHSLTRIRACAERDERFAGGDPDPDLELALLGERVADGERGPDGPLGIVLVRDRCAEHRHDCVADELLDGAAMALELGA